MMSFHSRSSLNVIPRSLCDCLVMIMLPLIVYDVGNFWLKDKWQLLDELKCKLEDVLHVQLKRLSGSRCNSCLPGGVLMCLKHLVSSAKSRA